jgi:pyruvate kinase
LAERRLPPKKTKIVCTIGPASESRETLERMIRNGMNVAGLNFAHGDFESHSRVIANIRAAAAAVGERVAIMGDLPGPKMRIGRLAEESINLERDQPFILQTEEMLGDASRVSMSFADLPQAVRTGDKIYLNDGFVQLAVEKVEGREVQCRELVGGELRSFKGVNLPGINLGISAFTDRDREFLSVAARQGLDAVSQSFVQDAADIDAVRQNATAMDYHPFIIAKLERARAIEELDNILESADGIMVARGDLGVEIPIEKVALVQKQMIQQANLFGKPVITATHMLESMTTHRRPTRAEVTDVVSPTESTCQHLQFSYGVYPVREAERPKNWEQYAWDWLRRHNVTGDLALLTQGSVTFHAGGTNDIKIIDLKSRPSGRSIW